jgi:signal transduction histidine kinase
VDDHEIGRYAKVQTLEQAGFRVLEATTGQEALRVVAENRPVLVVLDVQLPDLNGISVCRAIKSNPATASTMVLQVSAYYTSTDHQIEGLDSGADSYIPGDVTPVLLVAVVRALLRTRRVEEALREREERLKLVEALAQSHQERLQLVEALARSQNELRALAAGLFKAQEEERRRLARELHDDISQRLALLEIQLTKLRSAELSGPLNVIIGQVSALSQELRDLSHNLHPSVLEHLGLPIGLGCLCEEFDRNNGIGVQFIDRTDGTPIPSPIATTLYRIAQEALRNVAKHAGDARVTMTLWSTPPGEMSLSIHDDGCGFDMSAIGHKAGLGLISMQERIRLVGGTVELHSIPGHGTTVNVRAPWPEDA